MSKPINQTEPKTSGKKPSHHAYQVRECEGSEKPRWTKIGVGFRHRDGEGINVLLDEAPVDGRVILRSVSKDKSGD